MNYSDGTPLRGTIEEHVGMVFIIMDQIYYFTLLVFNNILFISMYIQVYPAKPKRWLLVFLVNKVSKGGQYFIF